MRCLPRLLLLVLLLVPVSGVAATGSAFIVAVVRDDGVMLPVATFDRGRWRMPWPGPANRSPAAPPSNALAPPAAASAGMWHCCAR